MALEALTSRFDHTAAIARLVAHHTKLDVDTAMTLRGIAATLDDLCERLDALANSGGEERS